MREVRLFGDDTVSVEAEPRTRWGARGCELVLVAAGARTRLTAEIVPMPDLWTWTLAIARVIGRERGAPDVWCLDPFAVALSRLVDDVTIDAFVAHVQRERERIIEAMTGDQGEGA